MKIGFIGIGNMASAIINGISDKESIIISGRTLESTMTKSLELGVAYAKTHQECVAKSDIVILGVKPEIIGDILLEIKDTLKHQTLVSIAAKVSLKQLTDLSHYPKIVRAMPNLNAAIKQGSTALVLPESISYEHRTSIIKIFESIGSVNIINEDQMSGFIGLAGSLPAFVFKFIDAIAQECQSEGYAYEEALAIASSAVAGSANYLKQSNTDPKTLTKRVCSPGGTTIEGVNELDALGFEETLKRSIRKVINKDKKGI